MKKDTLRKVLREIKPYRFRVGLSFILSILTVLSSLYVPILIGNAIDAITDGIFLGHLIHPVLEIIRQIILVIFITAVCQWAAGILNNHVVYHITANLRNRVFEHIQHLPLSYLDRHPSGDLVSRMIADVDQLSDGLLMGFTQLFTGLLTILGTFVFMLTVDVWIALVVVALTPVSLFIARFISKKSYVHFEAQVKSRGEETAFVNEVITGEKSVKAYGREWQTVERFSELNEALRKNSLKAVFYSSLVNPTTRFVNALVYAFVGVFGGLAVIRTGGVFSLGRLTVFLTYANQHTKPYAEITSVITELQNAFASADRVFALLEEPAETETAEAGVTPSTEGRVEFDRVSFSYVPEVPLIRNFDLTVEPGQHIAIVGRTGCGKTTLINLIMRFYEVNSGEIRIDGVPTKDMTRAELRAKFGMVLQDSWVRSGTIRENIRIGKPDATEEEIVEAAKKSHAHNFIRRLPKGYDTVLSEGGNELSEGQKQLLCIARVMLALPPMLILDEATSSIDTRTELLIQDAFSSLMKGRTSFIVAHRLSTIRNADRILVMADGHIVEQGRHEELLSLGGAYAALYESQFKGIAI
ncbi:MAG: ABC transporter ATP-binding protein [Lachnospiraceae bacterium]|nr:ABC transporter ATP-binding protein [Lachnospiraceae bacterium]